MQNPTFFESEIVQPKNLDFLTDSSAKNTKDVVVALTNGNPGVAAGLNVTGVSGNNYFTVSSGYGFMGDGERLQVFTSGLNVSIDFTGTKYVYANIGAAVYNPDPSENPLGASNIITNIDPNTGDLIAVENYNIASITTTSGSGYITLGTISSDSSMLLTSTSQTGSQHLIIGGLIDINTSTLNGTNIASGSIDSNIFTNPLSYDFSLGSGLSISLAGSGDANIGSTSKPLSNIYALTGNFHEISGFSPIIIDSMWQRTGTSLEATGINTVQIDRNQLGTQFGRGMVISADTISTVGLDKNINISTDTLKRVNIDATTNIMAGNTLFVNGDLVVSGTSQFSSTNISNIAGNLDVAGSINFGSSTQDFSNQIRNSNFNITISGSNYTGISASTLAPADWTISNPNTLLGQKFSGTVVGTGTDTVYSPTTQNSYLASPHTSTFLMCSGQQIDTTGVSISQSLTSLKPNTNYNVSYYLKSYSGTDAISFISFVSGTVNGTGIISSQSTPISSTEWTRSAFNITTNATGSNYVFGSTINSPTLGTTGTSLLRFGLAGVQITEGEAIIGYQNRERNRLLDIPLTDYKANFYNGAGIQSVYSKTFNSNGGFAMISALLNVGMARYSSPNGIDQQYRVLMYIDGSLVASTRTIIPYSVVNTMPIYVVGGFGAYIWSDNRNMSCSKYISAGSHTIDIKLQIEGGGTGVLNTYYIYGSYNPIQVMLFE